MLTVATWNLENLFLPGGESGPRDEQAYEVKLASLAETIDALAPDVLAVQEVGDEPAFDDLKQRLTGEWDSVLSTQPDERGIRVGFLSRHAIASAGQLRAFPARVEPVRLEDDGTTTRELARGALHVRIEPPGSVPVDLVTAHLKSKLLRFADNRFSPRDEDERARYAGYALALRAAEAVTLRHRATSLLDGHGQDRAVIVLGDLNDEPLAATTQILLGPPGSELGTGGFEPPDKGDGQRLWNIAPALPEGRAFSRVFNGRPELIDHILVSHVLAHNLKAADTGTAPLPSITSDPRLRRDDPGSDHAPVIASFAL